MHQLGKVQILKGYSLSLAGISGEAGGSVALNRGLLSILPRLLMCQLSRVQVSLTTYYDCVEGSGYLQAKMSDIYLKGFLQSEIWIALSL